MGDKKLSTASIKVKKALEDSGFNTTRNLGKAFRDMDTDRSGQLSKDDNLPKFLKDLGVVLTGPEITRLLNDMDTDESGTISLSEFIAFFMPEISEKRMNLLDVVFSKIISPEGANKVPVEEFVNRLANGNFVEIHSRKIRKGMFASEITEMFDADHDGQIEKNDFFNFYRELSPFYSTDEEFEAMLHASWPLK